MREQSPLLHTHTHTGKDNIQAGKNSDSYTDRNNKTERSTDSDLACSWLDDTQSASISVFNMTPTRDWWL